MTVQEISTNLADILDKYAIDLANYSAEQFAHKNEPGIWSLAQMYEHLVITGNFFFLKNIKYCLEQRNGQMGGEHNDAAANVIKYKSFPPIKIKVPDPNLEQPIARPMAEFSSAVLKMKEQILAQQDTISTADLAYKTIHPIFGWLNAQEWLLMFYTHHKHHLRQKQELDGFLAEIS